MKTARKIFIFIFLSIIFASQVSAQKDFQKRLQTKLIMAKEGDVIEIEEGRFQLSASLSLDDKKNITIRGKGMDRTILSFKGQTEGAEGIKVTNAQNITIEGLTVQDSKGDGIKTQNVNGITFKEVKTEWTGKPNKKNGGYGLYPVQCANVVIDKCVAIGASDAGIYVGQSKDIVVKNSKAYHNVAGIEIENSINAEVFENEAYHNTGGLLVFDLPDLIQKKGGNVRVFRNKIHDNNLPNFAPKGNIVAKVPDGTGILILATNNVEVFENEIINNNSVGTGIISYFMTENPIKDEAYYPYPTGIYIHDNFYQRANVRPTGKGRFGQMFRFKLKFGKEVPHILYDGIVDPKTKNENGEIALESKICIKNNQNQTFANLDAANNFKNISKDITPYNCELKQLKAEKIDK
jgi:parallel beta-helix repeat protein